MVFRYHLCPIKSSLVEFLVCLRSSVVSCWVELSTTTSCACWVHVPGLALVRNLTCVYTALQIHGLLVSSSILLCVSYIIWPCYLTNDGIVLFVCRFYDSVRLSSFLFVHAGCSSQNPMPLSSTSLLRCKEPGCVSSCDFEQMADRNRLRKSAKEMIDDCYMPSCSTKSYCPKFLVVLCWEAQSPSLLDLNPRSGTHIFSSLPWLCLFHFSPLHMFEAAVFLDKAWWMQIVCSQTVLISLAGG